MSTRTGRKISGGRYVARRKKKSYELRNTRTIVKLSKVEKKKTKKTRGGNIKTILINAKFVNVGKKKLEIKNVLETPSNRFLARQNIITKGTIVETSDGKVKVTNRPSQDGMINGILLK